MPATALPPLSAAEVRALHGQYRDRTGRQFAITVRVPYGFGLYWLDPADTYESRNAPPLQTDARELRRLISFESFTRLY